ncbi:helix-turn-helix domain-containing protein [Neobacillus niacini]|uniref:helix-turn-helix domain-containing protein n=1 Tax=Neobacillus niacini TaxID=86668 RepID=UPI0021CB70F3|nr:helix-turn-helix transcriptional regulator [Neobacillus niacini]MCM3765813.1 helix-turn-helix domain-containing protein [Neobacillus niacini]
MDGQILQRLRKEKGLSITKLSILTGISKSYISLLERGIQTNPSLDILEKIAQALQVDVEYLVKNRIGTSPSNNDKEPGMNKLKVEIELNEEQLSPQKIKQIKDLLDAINSDK